jgi:RHS repeat-associated protein
VQELDGLAGLIRSYAWDSRGRQLYVQTGANVYYEITNPHGDVVALASSSALMGTVHFDAWGNRLTTSGTAIPYGFQGSEGSWTSVTTGFVSMGARWYYPKVGRFLSSDPAAGTTEPRTPLAGMRWLYALDSPLRNTDPSGLGVCWTEEAISCSPHYKPPPDPPQAAPADCDRNCPNATSSDSSYSPPPPPKPVPSRPTPKSQPKHSCAWWDVACKAKQAWNDTTNAIGAAWNYCKSSDICKTVVTIGVGVVVFAGCEAITAGVGSVGCAIAAGAVSGAVSGAMDCKSGQSMGGCIAAGAAVGAVTGLVGGVAGKVIATVGTKIAGAVISRLSSKLAAGEQNVIKDVVQACMRNSFAAGTLVLMADGTRKPIEQVQPGDMVMAGDPENDIVRPEPVEVVIVGHGLKHLYDIQVDGDVIEATYNHPFWVIETQSFVWAQNLVPGQHVLLADGRAPPITAISHHDEITTVYNLSIESIHTFFVGSASVLVHNCPENVAGGLTKGANGALRDPATGRFAPNPNTAAKLVSDGTHGNSLNSPRPATLYAKYDAKGVFQKFGISQNPGARYSKVKLNGGYLEEIITGPRAWIRQIEYHMNTLEPGPEMVRP